MWTSWYVDAFEELLKNGVGCALGRFGYALDPMLAHRVRPDYAGLALAARPRLTSLARRLVQPVRAAGPRAEAANAETYDADLR